MDASSMQESKSAIVHGVIFSAVFPVKLSWNTLQRYFEVKFSDGIKSLQMVSFKLKLRSEIEEAGKVKTWCSYYLL